MPIDKRTRVILNNLLRDNELYGAHQKYRTTASRLLKTPAPSSFGTSSSKAAAASSSSSSTEAPLPFDDGAKDAVELLYEGSKALLEKGEFGGGSDLALYLIDTWKSRGVRCSEGDNRSKVQHLIALVGNAGKWRKPIVDQACAWTASNPETPAGDAALHAYIGQVLYRDRDFVGAEHHFLAAQTRDSAKALCVLLFDWFKTDPSSNASASTLGRYAARGVLSFLEGYSIACANVFLESFIKLSTAANPSLVVEQIPSTSSSTSSSSSSDKEEQITIAKIQSLNFLQLVVKTCETGLAEQSVRRPGNNGGNQMQTVYPGKQACIQLCQKYEREVPWLKEPEVKESLGIIGEMYFDIKPAGSGGQNILGDLMSSLFGGGGSGAGGASGSGNQKAIKGKGKPRGRIAPKIGAESLD